jgi:hypothetical protein
VTNLAIKIETSGVEQFAYGTVDGDKVYTKHGTFPIEGAEIIEGEKLESLIQNNPVLKKMLGIPMCAKHGPKDITPTGRASCAACKAEKDAAKSAENERLMEELRQYASSVMNGE